MGGRDDAPRRRRANAGLVRMVKWAGMDRRGFRSSRGWFYIGTGLWTLRTIRRLAARKPEILLSEVLRPGERLMIANGRATIDSSPVQAPVGAAGNRRWRSR